MPMENKKISSPDDPLLSELCDQLLLLGEGLEQAEPETTPWPHQQLRLASEYGVDHWFIPKQLGGFGWSQREIADGYLRLAAACLTTTFIITQRVAATKRIVSSANQPLRERLIAEILAGEAQATVGISHLTTSHRHVGHSVLNAKETEAGFLLDGFSPWVTGGYGAKYLVLGAQLEDERQVLLAVPRDTPGLTVEPGFSLVALTASQTGAVRCDKIELDRDWLVAGPVEQVLMSGAVSATGGFQTSALAIGLASAAVDYIGGESDRRPGLSDTYDSLKEQLNDATRKLRELAEGNPVCTSEQLRIDANSLVLRATQAALVAAKGTGFVEGHPVGRWCQEALFFLVWSCPQAVANANLCEFAGIESTQS